MANFRRRRPRKQPRSVMSSSNRIFETARDKSVDLEEAPKHQKKKRKKPFGIQIKFQGSSKWHRHGWYETEAKRDQAFENLTGKKTVYSDRIQYRKASRESSCPQL